MSKKFSLYCPFDGDGLVFTEPSDQWLCPKCKKVWDSTGHLLEDLDGELDRLRAENAVLAGLNSGLRLKLDAQASVLLEQNRPLAAELESLFPEGLELIWIPNGQPGWYATGNGISVKGKTPDEALAKLLAETEKK